MESPLNPKQKTPRLHSRKIQHHQVEEIWRETEIQREVQETGKEKKG